MLEFLFRSDWTLAARGAARVKLRQNGIVSFLIRLAVFSGQRRRLYETTPKWHGFLMIKLAAYQVNGGTRMKLRLAGKANRLNIEHRTSNIERRI